MAQSITEKAMLVSVAITQFGNRRNEQHVSDKVANDHGAEKPMGRYTKRLLAKEATTKITALAARARTFHYENTLPWLDNGFRILPAANFFAYTGEIAKLRREFGEAVDAFLTEYPAFVEDARKRLGTLFNERDYPTAARLRARYAMETGFMPMPDAADFRVEMADDDMNAVRADIERRTNDALAAAVKDLWQRLMDAVVHLRDRLQAYEVDNEGKVHHPFRDSAVLHLRELCALLPRLNITGDAELEAMRVKLEASLAAAEPSELREDPRARRRAVSKANEILAALAGYCGDDESMSIAAE